ncbi:A Receptor for Ubiquitination Targets [Rhizoctonia solani]|uniref:A Receptor for Ubiquitination Targets n=1 Tax=Rhizoctonia solani TaxID=456999 RepID=A0A8H7LL64_9AGAM|nr:A Receptor for Ubiquitination Targets [Rhizoctonia solani]
MHDNTYSDFCRRGLSSKSLRGAVRSGESSGVDSTDRVGFHKDMKELLTYAQNANPTEEPGKSSKDDGSELIVTDSLNELEGALRGVIGLPIEILIEVLGYLALPDTLALSRSSKFFRRILMNPSAATLNVWRASIENVPGLPSCPKDLSEPQYAALIYSHHCTVCGTSTSEPMDPYLNTRLCQDCIETNIVAVEDIKDEVVGVLIPQSPSKYVCVRPRGPSEHMQSLG